MEDLNNYHHSIKISYASTRNCVPFLDLDIHLSEGELTLDLHIKPANRHQYLYLMSSHPNHTKCSNVYSQALRVSKIYSREWDFFKHISEMKTWIGLSRNLVESEMKTTQVFIYIYIYLLQSRCSNNVWYFQSH